MEWDYGKIHGGRDSIGRGGGVLGGGLGGENKKQYFLSEVGWNLKEGQ
jgi:hypothetical protein